MNLKEIKAAFQSYRNPAETLRKLIMGIPAIPTFRHQHFHYTTLEQVVNHRLQQFVFFQYTVQIFQFIFINPYFVRIKTIVVEYSNQIRSIFNIGIMMNFNNIIFQIKCSLLRVGYV